jgi:hypothetical protein
VKILRQTPLELVTEESTLWFSVVCAFASLPQFYLSLTHGMRGALFGAGLFALFALLAYTKMTFVFDAVRRTVHWNGRKLYKVESGTIAFDEIIGVGTETYPGSEGGESYRLALLTAKGSVPMAYSYGGNSPRYESLRKTILAFIRPDHSNTASLEVTSLNGAIAENDLSIR